MVQEAVEVQPVDVFPVDIEEEPWYDLGQSGTTTLDDPELPDEAQLWQLRCYHRQMEASVGALRTKVSLVADKQAQTAAQVENILRRMEVLSARREMPGMMGSFSGFFAHSRKSCGARARARERIHRQDEDCNDDEQIDDICKKAYDEDCEVIAIPRVRFVKGVPIPRTAWRRLLLVMLCLSIFFILLFNQLSMGKLLMGWAGHQHADSVSKAAQLHGDGLMAAIQERQQRQRDHWQHDRKKRKEDRKARRQKAERKYAYAYAYAGYSYDYD